MDDSAAAFAPLVTFDAFPGESYGAVAATAFVGF